MEVDRTKLIGLGASLTTLMVLLEILGSLGFHTGSNHQVSIILFYIIVSVVLAASFTFTIYHSRKRCLESIIV